MRALTWHGKHDVRVDTVDDPEILNPRDAIIRITSTAICGSPLPAAAAIIAASINIPPVTMATRLTIRTSARKCTASRCRVCSATAI